jgi:hypothetical protein
MNKRVVLKKSWKNKFEKVYPVGTILQVDKELFTELIDEGYGDDYKGEYPPKKKLKIKMSNLNN